MSVDKEVIKPTYSLINKGGTIYLPEWCRDDLMNLVVPSEQDLFKDTASQEYPIGTQLRKNGKLYRYSKAGEAMAAGTQGFMKVNRTICPGSGSNNNHYGFEGALYADAAAGATTLQIADTAAALNEYEGGLFVVYDSTSSIYANHQILGNDASTGVYTNLYIADPGLQVVLTTSHGITVYRNPYIDVGCKLTSANQAYCSVIGYATFPIEDDYYFWLQTAGPISGITFDSGYTAGIVAYGRDVYANTDGSLFGQAATARYYQRIGYILAKTASDYADNFIMLQLDQ